MNPVNDDGIRMFKVTVTSASATPPQQDDWLPFFEKFGAIDRIDAPTDGSNEFFLTYRSAGAASLLRCKHREPIHINGLTIAYELAPSQPTEPFTYLTSLPSTCMENILSCLQRYDLIRFSQVNQHTFNEVRLEMNRRNILLTPCEWEAMKHRRLIFDEEYGPSDHSYRLLKCMKGNAERLEFRAHSGGYSRSGNNEWLSMIKDAAHFLPPVPQLRSMSFRNIEFDDTWPHTVYLPLFTNLTHLSLYRVKCLEYVLRRFMRATRTLRTLVLREMRDVTGTFLIDVNCHLQHLSFSDCPQMLPRNEQMTFLDQNCRLISLKWRRSSGIALYHLWQSSRKLDRLESVDIDNNEDEGALWYFTMNNLAALPSLRRLRLRLNPNIYVSLVPLRPLAYRNQLELLDINGGVLENALLYQLSHATNLHTLILTELNTNAWEPYVTGDAEALKYFIDLGNALINLRHFAISIRAHPPRNSWWLMDFVANAKQLETLEFRDHNYLYKLYMMGKLIDICKRRGNNVRLTVIVGSSCHANLFNDSRMMIDKAQANDVISIRRG